MRSYRIISKQNNIISWGGGLSQIKPKRFIGKEKILEISETISILLKGTFIFEDVLLNYSDELLIMVNDNLLSFNDNQINIKESFVFIHSSNKNNNTDNIKNINDSLIILKEEV